MEWRDDPLRPSREALLAERESQGHPVEDGSIKLLPENEEAAKVYMLTRGQVVTAGQGMVVDVSIPAIKVVMDLQSVRDQRTCLTKVLHLFHEMESRRADES